MKLDLVIEWSGKSIGRRVSKRAMGMFSVIGCRSLQSKVKRLMLDREDRFTIEDRVFRAQLRSSVSSP